ncbi:xylulokinase [Glaciecola petra]|uniref:Xylulose kinase n=1 Tax=Glaciecola petra TaxID=3075602 RepID=A0ABU2ZY36_9ALTE|nr:xylulokinase [Aestuariibacter sp. P117]MDT0596494.1 xylulokinase [Aestuariibacter sp. P117]
MYLGVDLGTSGIKVIVMNAEGSILATAQESLDVSQPAPLWSEQAPADWWSAFDKAMLTLAKKGLLNTIKAIGLSGQMHGAVLLDKQNKVLRPAILWNDGRSAQQCEELEINVPQSRLITGNMMMPGFTAPKLLWVKQNEPDVFAKVAKVLLPKDYLRFLLSGDFVSEMSDAAGTMWLDTGKRAWSEDLLEATGLRIEHMPSLVEGSQITGHVSLKLAERWGLQSALPIVGGGGDNAAGAIGVGLTEPGQAMISLGTSGVYFVVADTYKSKPEKAVHSFCHALPNKWHLMSVLLSAASCLQWFADKIVEQSVADLFEQLEQALNDNPEILDSRPYFLPYLSGERTPHNNPHAQGNFFGLTHATNKIAMFYAVLEGVSFAFADGVDALHASGASAKEITVIGGGARSPIWRQMLSDVLNKTIVFRSGGEVGPALGAARLAQVATDSTRNMLDICPQPPIVETHTPNLLNHAKFIKRRDTFTRLYSQLNSLFI